MVRILFEVTLELVCTLDVASFWMMSALACPARSEARPRMMCYAGDTSCASDANIIHATSRKHYENQLGVTSTKRWMLGCCARMLHATCHMPHATGTLLLSRIGFVVLLACKRDGRSKVR